tara:strand:- start:4337 stop:5509 length:1173 start_codon:yes stop_codon:yes gene_type:complete
MRKNHQGHAWCYWDCRRKGSGGYWFIMMSNEEIDRAIQELTTAGALKLYLYILKMVNGKTMDRFQDGQMLGEELISKACKMSRATMYRATKELEKAGLLSISKFGGETKALLVSPQKGVELDHRRSIKDEKNSEKNKNLQSQIRDCPISQNLDEDTQLCKKTQSQICDNKQDPQELNYPPYTAPIDQAVANDTEFKKLARFKEAGKFKKKHSENKEKSFLEGVSSELIEILCSIFARTDENLNAARLSPVKTTQSLTAPSLKNGHSTLNHHGWYGSHRKRYIQRAIEGVLSVYFNKHTQEATIKKYRDAAKPIKKSNAPKTQKRIKTLNDKQLLQYAKEIAELRRLPKDDPNRFGTIMRYLSDFERIETDYTLTPDQEQLLKKLFKELIE